MIPKMTTFTPPLTDSQIVLLERFLSRISRDGVQYRMGSYTGDGRDGRALTLGIPILFIYIQRKASGAGNAVFALREAEGVAFVPGSGFVSDAVKTFTLDGITLGTNTDGNQSGVHYAYFAVG